MEMYKVLLAEDEELILEGMKELIDWQGLGLRIVHMARNGEEALALWEQEQTDIVITDINMPKKSGLDFIEAIRKRDRRTRCIILTGYDEFDYAKQAVSMDVEDYILKPIDEDQLMEALKKAMEKLEHQDHRFNFFHFLSGNMKGEGLGEQLEKSGLSESPPYVLGKIIWEKGKVDGSQLFLSLKEQYKKQSVHFFYEGKEEIVGVKYRDALGEPASMDERAWVEYFINMQNHIESKMEIRTFFAVSSIGTGDILEELPKLYKSLNKMQKYLLTEGYGACVYGSYIEGRKSQDIVLDEEAFRKRILSRDRKGAAEYLEDLFLNNMEKDRAVEDLYKLSVKIALLFQHIMDEFKLERLKKENDMTDLIEKIYKVEDLSMLKGIFIALAVSIMEEIQTEKSSYTPVVRQILSEVERDYKQDLNLKALAHKYKINTSYLGQIFQKEVGCSFTHYVNNIKNAKAREMILNTNMKIIDIARELGYSEPSYFYRKFKQCYGISPASLRDCVKSETKNSLENVH